MMIIEATDDEWYFQIIWEEHRSMIHISVKYNVAGVQFLLPLKSLLQENEFCI